MSKNIVSNNENNGITYQSGENNRIFANRIFYNTRYGIKTTSLKSTSVIWNIFIENNIGGLSQAYDSSKIHPQTVYSYNYWDKWTSPDDDVDGFVDDPYPLDGDSYSKDLHPLANLHFISKPYIEYPTGGKVLTGIVPIIWTEAWDSMDHYITYSVYYSSDGGSLWIKLASGLTIRRYEWDTTTVSNGSTYLIKVIATCSEGITSEDTSDSNITINNIITTDTAISTSIESHTSKSTERSSTQTSFPTVFTIFLAISILTLLLRKRNKT